MKFIEPSIEVINPWGEGPEGWVRSFKHIERIARICYRSEDKVTDTSYKSMIKRLKSNKHGAMLEHSGFTVIFRTDRGITHEMVRHRIASFAQESTRYCNYLGKDMEFIPPLEISAEQMDLFEKWCVDAENLYNKLVASGCTPQQARDMLPTCVASTIAITASCREWVEVIFPLRDAPTAHPKMQYIMHQLLELLCDDGASLMFGHLLNKEAN